MGRKNMTVIRRAEVSQALFRCIVKRGYVNTSVRDIAREAGLRSGVIHYYFDSKEEILTTLFEQMFEGYQQSFYHLVEQHRDKPAGKRLKLGIDFIFQKIIRDKDWIKAFYEFWNLSQHDEKLHSLLKRMYREYRKEAAEFIAQCLSDLDRKPENVKELAAFLVSAGEGAGIQWFIDPSGISLSKLSKAAYQMVDTITAQAK